MKSKPLNRVMPAQNCYFFIYKLVMILLRWAF